MKLFSGTFFALLLVSIVLYSKDITHASLGESGSLALESATHSRTPNAFLLRDRDLPVQRQTLDQCRRVAPTGQKITVFGTVQSVIFDDVEEVSRVRIVFPPQLGSVVLVYKHTNGVKAVPKIEDGVSCSFAASHLRCVMDGHLPAQCRIGETKVSSAHQ